jgi:hypothetical protein
MLNHAGLAVCVADFIAPALIVPRHSCRRSGDGTSGYISTMAWDKDNHLYALNAFSGRLHVYTATSTGVVEAAGSPYNLPYCGHAYNATHCPQTRVVRWVPQAKAADSLAG